MVRFWVSGVSLGMPTCRMVYLHGQYMHVSPWALITTYNLLPTPLIWEVLVPSRAIVVTNHAAILILQVHKRVNCYRTNVV